MNAGRPTPDLPLTPHTTDVTAWRKRIEAKREAAHRRKALDLAAFLSQLDARNTKRVTA